MPICGCTAIKIDESKGEAIVTLEDGSERVFKEDDFVSLNGNTAPYMLYAYARICGIVRKASWAVRSQNNMIGMQAIT